MEATSPLYGFLLKKSKTGFKHDASTEWMSFNYNIQSITD